MPTVRETVAEMVQYVFPQYAGAPDLLYGGRMMEWIATAGTLAASRVARGPVVVGAMDDLDFLHPVRVGDISILRARVEWVGAKSLEVGVRVYSERPATGERHVTLSSHLAFVAVDERGTRPVEARIVPADAAERRVVEAAQARRETRRARLAHRAERAREVEDDTTAGSRWRSEVSRFVFPEDALQGNLMFAGRLLFTMDAVAALLPVRYARAPLATASMDALEFFAPIRVGDVLIMRCALNRVGGRSMEVGVQVLAEAPFTGEIRHTCTAFLTFVKLRGSESELLPLEPSLPLTEVEQRNWEAAEKRHAVRLARVRQLKESFATESPW